MSSCARALSRSSFVIRPAPSSPSAFFSHHSFFFRSLLSFFASSFAFCNACFFRTFSSCTRRRSDLSLFAAAISSSFSLTSTSVLSSYR